MKNPMHIHIRRKLKSAAKVLDEALLFTGSLETTPQTLQCLANIRLALKKTERAQGVLTLIEESEA